MAQMLENLKLTSEQWDQVRTLARDRLEKMADLWAQRMKLQIELAGLRWDKEIDPQKVTLQRHLKGQPFKFIDNN